MKIASFLPVLFAFVSLPAIPCAAGEWLGGQYWGQISGCGECGGSLYGYFWAAPCCQETIPFGEPTPAELDVQPEAVRVQVRDATPVLQPAAFSRPVEIGESLLLPGENIIPRQAQPAQMESESTSPSGGVKVITHTSRPERFRNESFRFVSPGVWNDRMLR